MLLHVPTLTVATFAATAILSLLMFCTWLQDRHERALLYWGSAGFSGAFALALLVTDVGWPVATRVNCAEGLFILWAGLTWCGARRFHGRSAGIEWVVAAVLVWTVIGHTSLLGPNTSLTHLAFAIGLRIAFVSLALLEFWRGRGERLLSRLAVFATLGIHVFALAMRFPVIAFAELPPEPALFQSLWLGVAALGQLLYTTAITFVLLAMTKERAEAALREAARTDPLTGLLNRRAFLQQGAECLARAERDGSPIAALIFDLDGFKGINDRYGHATGDRVLRRFAEILRATLGEAAAIGRIGGEEFAAVLPDRGIRRATEAAERIRFALASAPGVDEMERPMVTTVSVGVAVRKERGSLAALLGEADRAVYLAKSSGRNCVRTAADEIPRERGPSAAEGKAALADASLAA